jgi:hypothetical protein
MWAVHHAKLILCVIKGFYDKARCTSPASTNEPSHLNNIAVKCVVFALTVFNTIKPVGRRLYFLCAVGKLHLDEYQPFLLGACLHISQFALLLSVYFFDTGGANHFLYLAPYNCRVGDLGLRQAQQYRHEF